ncbi:MAG: hypothetical protein A3E36_02475 [Candidatus Andersenbacteria bacterium RIFCSPHIGHO2_12_FULL_45_11b]|uniref:Phosphoglycerate mutase n=1 Tax=Candidatus Andersenbacteria bacterium RIFCSPHIGHO2_12_FULL_45_11b TaxID=1797282 RepID=A0A1G1XB59_9BACT|nr:MAG: hypothetical protein A3E36_02475 [Candidatus Andersenbacteria bacterium RIFCSPHIGHO2_12_FULL_45_11b]
MKNAATFYIVRHGQTQWNIEGRLQGHGDSPLTEQGVEDIQAVTGSLKHIEFDHVFSSDLLRAKRTAELLVIEKKLAINTTHLLRERSFGKFEGVLIEEFRNQNKELLEKQEKLSKEESWKFKLAEDMESNEEIIQRLLVFLREIAVTYPNKTMLIVTHAGVLRILLEHLGYDVNPAKGMVKNGAYIKLLSDGDEFEVEELSGITLVENKQ